MTEKFSSIIEAARRYMEADQPPLVPEGQKPTKAPPVPPEGNLGIIPPSLLEEVKERLEQPQDPKDDPLDGYDEGDAGC